MIKQIPEVRSGSAEAGGSIAGVGIQRILSSVGKNVDFTLPSRLSLLTGSVQNTNLLGITVSATMLPFLLTV